MGFGLDVTGSITCSLDLNIEGDIDMAFGKKITWVDDTQYISGNTTGITIESDDTLQVNADTSVTFTTPQTTINGNLDITSGLDVTGSVTCSRVLILVLILTWLLVRRLRGWMIINIFLEQVQV